jgi:predicted esterase
MRMHNAPASDVAQQGRLRLPATVTTAQIPAGRSAVHVDGQRVGLWYVPQTPAERLLIVLHGAGGRAEDALGLLRPYADDHRLMVFAPQSVGRTWDMILSGYGPDVVRIQGALNQLLGAHRVAVPTLAIAGFSDGASYAVSLGLINGDIFDAVLAFSPGFAAPTRDADEPAFFVAHGRFDRVLPIDRCSGRLVPALRRAGHRVAYHEFDGGHEVPPSVIDAALTWLAAVRADR